MKRIVKLIAPLLIVAGIIGTPALSAVIDGHEKAQGNQVIIFPTVTSADTLDAIKVNYLHNQITFYVHLFSRRAGGFAAGDSLQVRLTRSANDTTYTNTSGTEDRITYTSAGQYTITYDYLATSKYVRLELPNMAAADSLSVNIKAVISPEAR